VPPPRYDGVLRACDSPAFIIRIREDAGGQPVIPWDSVGQLTRVLQGRPLADPRMQAWTQSFREQLEGVDQITHRLRTDADPVAFESARVARTPFPVVCTAEMHSTISAYYEALNAFVVNLPQLSVNTAQCGIAGGGSAGSAGQLALTRLAASVHELDAYLGTLPPPSWRPSLACMGVSSLAGAAGLVGAIGLPPISDDPRRPSDASMVLRVMISFLGFVPFFVLSARRAYLDDSDSEAFRRLKSHIADVQTELGRFAEMAGIQIAQTQTASS